MNRPISIFFAVAAASFSLKAQIFEAPKPDERFKVDLLVVVAHPDDETEIGAYLARAIFDEKKRVAVVFGTRGNQGGNAEGQEQSAAMGAIREIEARQALAHFDVSYVWFMNGTDTPGQDVLDSLETWDHGESLGRLVRLVRLTRPAVIATWLPDWVAGENHGDHQAAGVLATEAFDSAGDPTAFGEQLATPRNRRDIRNLTEGLHPWQAQKLYYFSDTAHPESLKGKGPQYSATDKSPARGVSYARLAAEECAFHLTQDDTGQMARTALADKDLHYFEEPVRFVYGKSHVESGLTADLFEGVSKEPMLYRRPPGFSPPNLTATTVELGDPWRFYMGFWQAHGLGNLATLIPPEILAKPSTPFVIPVSVLNPTKSDEVVELRVKLPEGWSIRRPLPERVRVPAGGRVDLVFEVKTGSGKEQQTVTISGTGKSGTFEPIQIRAELNPGAMPE